LDEAFKFWDTHSFADLDRTEPKWSKHIRTADQFQRRMGLTQWADLFPYLGKDKLQVAARPARGRVEGKREWI
jgi:hypothetical protein